MNLESETWDVINAYFRDTPNYLVRHHIDSYNDFIQNKIPQIFKNTAKNPQTKIVLLDKEDNIYEINIYFGGKNHDRYKISKPTIKNYPTGDIRQLYPNESRLKSLTYGFDIFYSVDIDFTFKKNDNIIFENVPINNPEFLENIHLGKIPIMLKSDVCILNEFSNDILSQMGEDPYDLGGYFIINGMEKTIVSQERKAENIIFLNTVNMSSGTEKYTHFAEVKCVSDESFANARTVKVQLESTGTITVRLGQTNPLLKENKTRDVPLFIMFRALGIESDKEILQYIIGDINLGNASNTNASNELINQMIELLRPSILDPFILEEKIYDRELAEAYLVKLPSRAQTESDNIKSISDIGRNKVTQLSYLYSTFNEALFPHITTQTGELNRAKAYYLGLMTRKLLLLKLGLIKDTDRDNFANKRIDLSGFLVATLFRSALDQVIRNVRVKTNTLFTFNMKEYSEDKIVYIINANNYKDIFSIEKFKEHFNDQLTIGNIGEKKGVVQALDRSTRNNTIAHLRRIIDNVQAGQRITISRRRLHATQYGCVCPDETPEGQSVGLNKGLAISSHITFGCPTKPILEFCIENGLEVLDEFTPIEVHNLCKIFINGNWVGCHRNPAELINIFRLYRRNGLINIYTSGSWDYNNNEIKIYTDGGRFIRPLYIVENNNILIQPKHINGINSKEYKFSDLILGFSKRKEDYDYYNCSIEKLDILGIKNDNMQENLFKLRENQAVIEYVDSQEFDTCLLSIGFTILETSLQQYTHLELHPSMMLSFNAHLIPFINFDMGARAIFASKHVKQGITTYAMNFNNRIDTNGIVLNNPEKPLLVCRLNNVLGGDKFGHGHNLFIAINKFNYNQEDAIIGNQSAIDMGLFGTSYYKMYSDKELLDKKTGEEHHFYNPMPQYKEEMYYYPDQNELPIKNRLQYSNLDKYGFPKKGNMIGLKDAVIGKYMKGKDEQGKEYYKDMTTEVKLGNEGSLIDKVYTCQTNENGDRMVKIRTCQHRPPVMGDKFSSRNGQKGTFGIVLKKEDLPYTEDGIVPDIILDPAGYPSRMTVNQLYEILFGNMAAELGLFGTYNAFETFNVEEINDILENKLGLTSMGERILYDGMTGKQIETTIFTGVIYYQRLKYMVDDKINTRTGGERSNGIPIPGGAYTVKERQSVAGRANGGGLRLGEMERDALLSHGIWAFIKESYIERCDKFIIQVSKTSGEISICNPDTGLYYDNLSDGIVSYQLDEDINKTTRLNANKIIGLNLYGQRQMEYIQIIVPYTFKLLIQEIQGMCMSVKMKVDYLQKLMNDSPDDGIIELTENDIDNDIDNMLDNILDKESDDDDKDVSDDNSEYNSDNQDGGNIDNAGANDIDNTGGDDIDNAGDDIDNAGDDIDNTDNQDGNISNAGDNNMQNGNTTQVLDGWNSVIKNENQRPNLNPDVMQNVMPKQSLQLNQQGGMEIKMDENTQSNDNIDLSHYGGVKPEFYVKEKDDNDVIENMNSKLLGLQTGGENEKFENAKTQGINNILDQNSMANNSMSNMNGGQQNTQGLNMSFNNQVMPQPMMQMQQQQQHQPMMQMQQQQQQQPMQQQQQQQPMMQNQFGGNSSGSSNGNNINFNSNIKVVELDTKVREGFFYSGSKNLDPFRK